MTIRKIVVPVHGHAGDRERLIAAGAVAARLSARIEAVFLRHDPREALPFVTGYIAKDITDQFTDALKAEDDAAEAQARATLQELSSDPRLAGVEFEAFPGPIEETVVRRARCADLVAASPYRADELADIRRVRDAALFDSGRPVLIAPPDAPSVVGSRCLVAWDGSAVAARAVEASLPLLSNAEEVNVLVVETDGPRIRDTEEIIEYLDLHGADAEIVRAPLQGTIGATMVAQAEALQTDLLIMGAYGHAWLREHMLGGTTRYVMLETRTAVLMAH
ncbi:universal stress protein [Microbaculum sp. FT89]|uniref:universal stress protein n=1 Tax=Microbaculum sp. FT89 TaxID=3447298 RepID=UPI003F52FBED